MALFDHLGDLPIMAEHARRLRASPDLAPFLLYNPAAVPAMMRALGGETDPAALERLAGDPNTSVEALSYLAGCFPRVFCANPIFPLLLLERPGLPAEMEPTSLGRLLAYAGVPTDFVRAVANYGPPDVASAARLHVALAGDVSADWRADLPRALAGITVIPDDDLMTALATLGLVPEWIQGRIALGAHPALLRALGHEAPAEKHLVAAKRKLHGRSLAAADPQRPWAELMALADDEDAEVRAALAGNPALSPTDLLQLKLREDCNDSDPRVYEALAANPQAPGELLRSIAMNRTALNTAARREVARNPATPPNVLILLADELYAADIRIILASHPNLGPEQRAIMVTSSLEAALGSGSPIYRAIALSHPAVDPAIIALALRSPHWIERLAVALSPAADSITLAHLTEDGNRLVRAAAQER